MDLRNRTFELVANADGHASGNTRLAFTDATAPQQAHFSGPNTTGGHAILDGNTMLYHARTEAGLLVAGRAHATVDDSTQNRCSSAQLRLDWSWISGTEGSGVSIWIEVASRT